MGTKFGGCSLQRLKKAKFIVHHKNDYLETERMIYPNFQRALLSSILPALLFKTDIRFQSFNIL